MRRKLCLACGYRGRELQGDRGQSTFVCPRCRADLYARPPRTYAEMEGFDGSPGDRALFRGSRAGALASTVPAPRGWSRLLASAIAGLRAWIVGPGRR